MIPIKQWSGGYRALARSLAVCALLLVCVIGVAGCNSGGAKSGSSDYVASFQAGRYSEAYDSASRAASSLRGMDRDQASLIAGLSAQALNRNEDAVRWLMPLSTSSDSALCGKSNAALGLIAQERSDHTRAVEHLTKAGTKLSGDEAARALMYAGDSLKAQGKISEANQTWATAQDKVVADVPLRVMIGDRLAGMSSAPGGSKSQPSTPGSSGIYSVQAGAFGTRAKAEQEASRLSRFGASRIVVIKKNGQQLYAVRVGRYATKPQADAVKRQVGGQSWVTTTADE